MLLQIFLLGQIDGVLTISNNSKADIEKYLHVKSDKIHVVHLAPWKVFKKVDDKNKLLKIKKKYNLPDKFVMFLGDVNFTKNISTLIKACKTANVTLVAVGKHINEIENMGTDIWDLNGPRDWIRFLFNKPHPEEAHYQKLASALNNNRNVIRTGFVTDEDLACIFSLATIYCQPSYYEGFGLPNVQAMACGVPVIASDIKTHREILGKAALYADPYDAYDFAKKIKLLLNSKRLREDLIKRGTKQVTKYKWEKFIKDSLNVYKKIMTDD